MFRGGKQPTVAEQVTELEHEILIARGEQRAAELNREQAVATELRALGAVDQSRAVQSRCDRIIGERVDAISSLQDEISALVPGQVDCGEESAE